MAREGRQRIVFSKPAFAEAEVAAITSVLRSGNLAGGGEATRRCQDQLVATTGATKALLTGSATQALEMACLLIDLKPGDEVILPSFTFSSSANAIVLRGAVPVFVDIDPGTMNIAPEAIEAAIGPKTKAVMPVHYAGVGCDMNRIMAIAKAHSLEVIEDAAQAIGAFYQDQALGTFGSLSALSFHVSKNISSGEGGALLINDPRHVARAEILWEKGTNRASFLRGEIDKYTWYDVGSSFLPSELTAALLYEQLVSTAEINDRRIAIWQRYHMGLHDLEVAGQLMRPRIPNHCRHNGHIYYVILPSEEIRAEVMAGLARSGISTQFHYVPLHSAPAGVTFGRTSGTLDKTTDLAGRLLRLPLFPGLSDDDQTYVMARLAEELRSA